MRNKSNIDKIMNIMEMMDPNPVAGMGGPSAMDASSLDELQMDTIPDQDQYRHHQSDGFHANDYVLARQLVAQVGDVERARELLSNLEQVIDTLDLKDKHVDDIAQCCDEIY